MHEKSLANFEGNKVRWKPGQSGNPKGRPGNPIVAVREKLTEVLNQEYWGD